jgi:hypothetical protein
VLKAFGNAVETSWGIVPLDLKTVVPIFRFESVSTITTKQAKGNRRTAVRHHRLMIMCIEGRDFKLIFQLPPSEDGNEKKFTRRLSNMFRGSKKAQSSRDNSPSPIRSSVNASQELPQDDNSNLQMNLNNNSIHNMNNAAIDNISVASDVNIDAKTKASHLRAPDATVRYNEESYS